MPALRKDTALREAEPLAREAAEDIAWSKTVGVHQNMEMVQERVATHYFACLATGYPGWSWAVTVTRVPRSTHVTVSEAVLVPGEGSLLSPDWVPYAERLAPGDVGPGDVTPRVAQDPLLEPGFEATGDEDVDAMAQWELGLGRARVLSAQGRDAAAQRWYNGDHGPGAEVAVKADGRCSACGYYLPMPGALRAVFGACTNAWSPSDGRVVSLDHGCGAHSETDVEAVDGPPARPPILDDFELELF